MTSEEFTAIKSLQAAVARLEADVSHLREEAAVLKERSVSDRVWELLMKVAVPLCIVLAATVIKHQSQLGSIAESRFTDREGEVLRRELHEHATATVAAAEARWAKAMADMPPAWLRDVVSELRTGQQDIMGRLVAVETKLEAK